MNANEIHVKVESRILNHFMGRIIDQCSLGNAPGLRPIVIEVGKNDRAELRHFFERLTTAVELLATNIVVMSCKELRQSFRHNALGTIKLIEEADGLLITDGEDVSFDFQRACVGESPESVRPLHLPPIFCVVTEGNPGLLFQRKIWDMPFRRLFTHFRFPTVDERRRDWPALFRAGVELKAKERNTIQLPTIERDAIDLIKSHGITFRPDEGTQAPIRLGMDSYRAMQRAKDEALTARHVIVNLPGSSGAGLIRVGVSDNPSAVQ